MHILHEVLRLIEMNRQLVTTSTTLVSHRVGLCMLSWQVTLQMKFKIANYDDILKRGTFKSH